MIQLEKVIERGEQDIEGGNLWWFKFADGTYLMGGGACSMDDSNR